MAQPRIEFDAIDDLVCSRAVKIDMTGSQVTVAIVYLTAFTSNIEQLFAMIQKESRR